MGVTQTTSGGYFQFTPLDYPLIQGQLDFAKALIFIRIGLLKFNNYKFF
jgi:hypothetical protein